MMNRTHYKSVLPLLVAIALLGAVGGCRGNSPDANAPSNDLTLTPAPPTGDSAENPGSPAPDADTAEGSPATRADVPPVTVTIFKADDQCVNFEPEQVEVSGDRPIEGAVGKVLEEQGGGDFDLNGYRISVDDATGMATVDLRMNPDSDRSLASLSACEQFALFGSLRETLLQNPQWNIKDVRFTESGEEIML